jgi:hypothetical protein
VVLFSFRVYRFQQTVTPDDGRVRPKQVVKREIDNKRVELWTENSVWMKSILMQMLKYNIPPSHLLYTHCLAVYRVRILSRMRGSVTYNKGFWIGWFDLLAILYNYNQLWQLSNDGCLRLAPFPIELRASSLLRDWLGSDLRIGHFFSFRCPLVNTAEHWTLFRMQNDWTLLNWTNFQANRI